MSESVQVVIIGGGVTGCSIAWHLVKAGWKDVLLIERSELTSGSTWHAAGSTGAFGGGANATFLHRYSFELYRRLEEETGQSCGFHHVGQLMLARSPSRLEELQRHHMLARRNGIASEWLDRAETLRRAPILDLATIKGVLFEHAWGHVDPNGVTHAFAKGAREHGAEIRRFTPVLATRALPDGGWEVVTDKGSIRARHVVNAAGLWAREVAGLAGISLPLMPVEHHYFVTEEIPEIKALDFEVPLILDADSEYYMRQEGKGLLVGVYEDRCTHWSVAGTPPDFSHELLPDALDRIERNLELAVESVPPLGRAGIKRVINGPMIFSPDLAPLVGPHPGLRNYWTACGVMTGFSQAAAIGWLLAQWMANGEAPLDISGWDVARFGAWADVDYTRARTGDMYSTRFKTIYPYEERAAGRPVRMTPAYAFHRERGAVFGASDGLEYPLWFAPPGVPAQDTLTFRRPNWFATVGEECRALHEGVGIIDISTYGKHIVRGPGAGRWLDHVLSNAMPTADGELALSAMLTHSGRLMGEFSVSRLTAEEYLLVGSGFMDRFHHRWWKQFLPADGVDVRSAADSLCGLSVSGPHSRRLLASLCDADLSGDAWPYRHVGRVRIGPAKNAILLRVAYTGELGFEIFVPPEDHLPLLHALLEAGAGMGVRLAGVRALNSLRIEKGFGAWGAEYALDYTPWECGMGFMVKADKGDFVGRDATLAARGSEKYAFRRFEVLVDDCDPWGDEPLLLDDTVAGFLTSAAFGHRTGKSLALGYLDAAFAGVTEGLQVEVMGARRAVRVLPKAAFDPSGERMRG